MRVNGDCLEVELTSESPVSASQIMIPQVIEYLSRVWLFLQGTLVPTLRFAESLLGIENGTHQNERSQIAGVLLKNGIERLFGCSGIAMLESRSGLVERDLRISLPAEKNGSDQEGEREQESFRPTCASTHRTYRMGAQILRSV